MTPLGSVMVDVAGLTLTDEERDFLLDPMVGGVILFARNYRDPSQLKSLTAEIRAVRTPHLLIAVDHEGGRVQRFREGFTRIPPMRAIGDHWQTDRTRALDLARAVGLIIGHELSGHGVDFSFTPVLDIDFGSSAVIGDRAFSADPVAIGELAAALSDGLRQAGVAAVGKHFPGHGYVVADSHVEIPRDDRAFVDIEASDLLPYRALIPAGLAAFMPAHVIYTAIDPAPAGFSPFWIRQILRTQLGFEGLVFSDDLTMEGAAVAGSIAERAERAFGAGCDMVLVCNSPGLARALVRDLRGKVPPLADRLASSMRASSDVLARKATEVAYQGALKTLASMGA